MLVALQNQNSTYSVIVAAISMGFPVLPDPTPGR